jgi:NitT/TauT family transport system permease protein
MSSSSALTRMPWFPAALGFGSFVLAVAIFEVLIRAGLINRFIVPMPSQIGAAFERVIVEEHLFERFVLTFKECLYAALLLAVFGISIGALLHKVDLLRRATETWVAAAASAPTVLMYPLFLVIFGRSATTIVMMGFIAGLPAVILKTVEGLFNFGGLGQLINDLAERYDLPGTYAAICFVILVSVVFFVVVERFERWLTRAV